MLGFDDTKGKFPDMRALYDGISKRNQKVAIPFKRHFDQRYIKNKEPDLTILGMKRKNGTDYRYICM